MRCLMQEGSHDRFVLKDPHECVELCLGLHIHLRFIEYTNMSVDNTTIFFIYIKIVYRQGDMFRPSLGHLQALKENRSKIM